MDLLKRGGSLYRKGERNRLEGIHNLLELHERGGFEAIQVAKGIESDSGTQRYIAEVYGVTQGRISQLVTLGRLLELLPNVEQHSVTEWMLRPLVKYLDTPQLAVGMFEEAVKLAEQEEKRMSCRFVRQAVKSMKPASPAGGAGNKGKYYGRNIGQPTTPSVPHDNDDDPVNAALCQAIATVLGLRSLRLRESKKAELGELVEDIVLSLQEFRHTI